MTAVVRLTMVSHGMTDALAAGRFPDDEPLNELGRRQVRKLGLQGNNVHVTGPERRARETAELFGLPGVVEPRVADLDCGAWRGLAVGAVDQRDLRSWLTEPDHAPHGGESIVDLTRRVAGWLHSLTEPTVAVTHPAVIRAAIVCALDAPPDSFWRIDIPPTSHTVLHFRDGRWTLRL